MASKRYVPTGDSERLINAGEAQGLIERRNTEPIKEARSNAKNKCRVCKLEGHNARTCVRGPI